MHTLSILSNDPLAWESGRLSYGAGTGTKVGYCGYLQSTTITITTITTMTARYMSICQYVCVLCFHQTELRLVNTPGDILSICALSMVKSCQMIKWKRVSWKLQCLKRQTVALWSRLKDKGQLSGEVNVHCPQLWMQSPHNQLSCKTDNG